MHRRRPQAKAGIKTGSVNARESMGEGGRGKGKG